MRKEKHVFLKNILIGKENQPGLGKILKRKVSSEVNSRTLGHETAISASGWLLGSVRIFLLLLLVCLKAGVED